LECISKTPVFQLQTFAIKQTNAVLQAMSGSSITHVLGFNASTSYISTHAHQLNNQSYAVLSAMPCSSITHFLGVNASTSYISTHAHQ
jgi:hypothetical protein